MTVEQIEPGPNGWSKWSVWPRKVRHICCDCNSAHDVEMRVDKKNVIWMRWRVNNAATSAMRRSWGLIRRELWQKFFT